MCKNKILTIICVVAAADCFAQSLTSDRSYDEFVSQAYRDYESFVEQSLDDYKKFIDKANAEYAEFMRRAWSECRLEMSLEPVVSPSPPDPAVYDPTLGADPVELPLGDVRLEDDGDEPASPVLPHSEPAGLRCRDLRFDFYGRSCSVRVCGDGDLSLRSTDEEAIAAVWTALSDGRCYPTVADCLSARDDLRLCDWAYLLFVKALSEARYDSAHADMQRLYMAYILVQSGYKIRLARFADGHLSPLAASDTEIYFRNYYTVGDDRFYIIDEKSNDSTAYLCGASFPGERAMSMYMPELPDLPVEEISCTVFASAIDPQLEIPVCIDRNMCDFLNDYPSCPVKVYARTPLSAHAKEQLYPVLRSSISGLSERDAANLLIGFVQTAFEYMTDDEQFGFERTFFPDELFFYSASDCEDRAVLYSALIRDLLGLEVMLVDYPGHIATAVRFNEDIDGDHYMVDGRRFLICDPTYIGAGIGIAMPAFKNCPAVDLIDLR